MVSLSAMRSSNAKVATALPPHLVAVFVGATSGIGEYSLKQFARHTTRPRAYFIGRSQDSGDRILRELKTLNPDGEYIFRKADVSLIRVVDEVCQEIKSKEKAINILCLSPGQLRFGTKTTENLHQSMSLIHYARIRFITNLLSLLQSATSIRRVVNVFTAGKEGPVITSDLQGLKLPIRSTIGHASALVTLSLEHLSKISPDVSFIHSFPGHVKSNLARGGQGLIIFVLAQVFKVTGMFKYHIPNEECGERHVFEMTSARYPVREGGDVNGIALEKGVEVARATDGSVGTGVYSVDEDGESYCERRPVGFEALKEMRKDGTRDKVWEDLESEWKRITGKEAI